MNAAVGTGAAGGVDVLGTHKDVLNDKQAQMAATLLELGQAKMLLRDAADEVNLFEGYTPRLADGESLTFGAGDFDDVEAKGLEAAAKTAFVLTCGDVRIELR